MKLHFIGPLLSTTGYASHFRGLTNALGKYHDIKISTMLQEGWKRQVNDFELLAIKKADDKDRINIIIDLPHNWPLYLNKKKNIGFLVFEGDKIPLSWIDNIKDERVNQIWTPSQHVYNAIQNTLQDEQYIIQDIMKKLGIEKAMRKQGLKDGDLVWIGDRTLEW